MSHLPVWLDWARLLGPGEWSITDQSTSLTVESRLDRHAAADLYARLRGVGIGGSRILLEIFPRLKRRDQREALTAEARRMRKGSVGFAKPGTRLDEEARFSLTPEALALEVGKKASGSRVIDACAGAGGNAIGFARAGCTVTAIELDASRLEMARHNASLYGVGDRIEFIQGDARNLIREMKADILFIDPPWGRDYNKERVALENLGPCSEILQAADHISQRWIKTPPSFDTTILKNCTPEAVFGAADGDSRRVKFLLIRCSRSSG